MRHIKTQLLMAILGWFKEIIQLPKNFQESYIFFNKNVAYLDVDGGYGMLTRLMRDYGFHFYWTDPYCQNILARGFEVEKVQKNLRH